MSGSPGRAAEQGAPSKAALASAISPPRSTLRLHHPATPPHASSSQDRGAEPGSASSRLSQLSSASRRRSRGGFLAEDREAAGERLMRWARSPAGADLPRDGLPDPAGLGEALQNKEVAGAWEALMTVTGPPRASRLGSKVAEFRASVDRVAGVDGGREAVGRELVLAARRNELVQKLADLQSDIDARGRELGSLLLQGEERAIALQTRRERCDRDRARAARLKARCWALEQHTTLLREAAARFRAGAAAAQDVVHSLAADPDGGAAQRHVTVLCARVEERLCAGAAAGGAALGGAGGARAERGAAVDLARQLMLLGVAAPRLLAALAALSTQETAGVAAAREPDAADAAGAAVGAALEALEAQLAEARAAHLAAFVEAEELRVEAAEAAAALEARVRTLERQLLAEAGGAEGCAGGGGAARLELILLQQERDLAGEGAALRAVEARVEALRADAARAGAAEAGLTARQRSVAASRRAVGDGKERLREFLRRNAAAAGALRTLHAELAAHCTDGVVGRGGAVRRAAAAAAAAVGGAAARAKAREEGAAGPASPLLAEGASPPRPVAAAAALLPRGAWPGSAPAAAARLAREAAAARATARAARAASDRARVARAGAPWDAAGAAASAERRAGRVGRAGAARGGGRGDARGADVPRGRAAHAKGGGPHHRVARAAGTVRRPVGQGVRIAPPRHDLTRPAPPAQRPRAGG